MRVFHFALIATLALPLVACESTSASRAELGKAEYAATLKQLQLENSKVELSKNYVTVKGAVRNRSDVTVSEVRLKTVCTTAKGKKDVEFTVGERRDAAQHLKPGSAMRFMIETPTLETYRTCSNIRVVSFDY